MKPVVHLLRAIQHVFLRNRQQGSSTRLKEIAQKHEAFIICVSREHARDFGPAGVSMQEIIRETDAHRPRALFFDNHTVNTLCTRVLEQFEADAEAVRNTEKVHQAMVNRLDQEVIRVMQDFKMSQHALTSANGENAVLMLQLNTVKQELLAAKIKLNARKVTRITVKRR